MAVARAVVGNPEVVLADEPTGNLDPDRSRELLTLFEAMRARGTTIILATHDPGVVRFGVAYQWRRIGLADGTIVEVPVEPLTDGALGSGKLVQLEGAMLRKLLEAG